MSRAVMTATKRKHAYITRVAYHEAGHAVMAILQRVPLTRVTIVPDDELEAAGHSAHQLSAGFLKRAKTGDLRQSDVQPRIMVLLAGPEAEYRLTGRRNKWGAHVDRKNAMVLAFSVCGSPELTADYLNCLSYKVEEITDSHIWYWQAIEALAAALLTKQTLSGRTARKIVLEVQVKSWLAGPADSVNHEVTRGP